MGPEAMLAAALDAEDWRTAALAAIHTPAGKHLPRLIIRDLFRIGTAQKISEIDIAKVRTVARHV